MDEGTKSGPMAFLGLMDCSSFTTLGTVITICSIARLWWQPLSGMLVLSSSLNADSYWYDSASALSSALVISLLLCCSGGFSNLVSTFTFDEWQ